MVSELKSLIWENVFNQPLSRRSLSFFLLLFFFFSLKEDGRYIEVCSLYALMSVERIQPGEISNFLDSKYVRGRFESRFHAHESLKLNYYI